MDKKEIFERLSSRVMGYDEINEILRIKSEIYDYKLLKELGEVRRKVEQYINEGMDEKAEKVVEKFEKKLNKIKKKLEEELKRAKRGAN
ncbi:MAG: hypothetical protein ACP5P2_01085 [Candidatus Micrarchaeia archaeon]